MKRDFFNESPRDLLALCLEDLFLTELHKTGRIEALGLYAIDVINGGKAYQGQSPATIVPPEIAESAFVVEVINQKLNLMDWGDE